MNRVTGFLTAFCVSLCTLTAMGAPDLSTPKAAALAFAKAVEAGNAAEAQAASVAEAQNQELAGTLAEVSGSAAKLREAAKAKFGDEAGDQIAGRMSSSELAKQLDAAEAKEDGDTATITSKDNPGAPLTLKKVDGQWKVDMLAGAQGAQMTQQLPLIKSLGGMMGELATEITDGKYKTVDDAKMAMQTKMMTAMANMKRPTTAPSTAPGQ